MRELSVPPLIKIADTETLTDPIWRNAEDTPDVAQFARRVGDDWQAVTCAQFRDEVVALARGLIAAGIEPGARVGLISKTRYEWSLIDYAIWSVGAVTVPIYETSSAEQVAWILSDSEAVACFVETGEHRETLTEMRGELPGLGHVWQIEPAGSEPGACEPGAIDELGDAGAAVPVNAVDERRAALRADDIATIIYTSGTTGRPKGCVLSHRNMYFNAANAIPGLANLFHEGAKTLLFLPLAHSFARLVQIGAVQARVTLGHTPNIKNLVADLKSFQPTFLLSAPRVFEKVYNTARTRAEADGKGSVFARAEQVAIAYSEALDSGGPGFVLRSEHKMFDKLVYAKLRAALGGACRAAISGSAPLGERLAHFFRGIGVTIYEGYGLTETSPACTANLEKSIKIGTVGRPLPGVTIGISDDGEILIQGEHVFRGYWKNDDATTEALDADGWLHTGDLGELDDEGYLRITGRTKELIVTAGGKNISPAALEDRVRSNPLVSQCLVIGDRQPFIAALVTLDESALKAWKSEHDKPADASPAELRDDADLRAAVQQAVEHANKAVSNAEAIKAFRILPRDFTEATGELTPSFKIKRTVVMKEHADEIAAIYPG